MKTQEEIETKLAELTESFSGFLRSLDKGMYENMPTEQLQQITLIKKAQIETLEWFLKIKNLGE